MNILECVPAGFSLRPEQVAALREVEQQWRTSDVIVLRLPVAFGKTLMALTIANWRAANGERSSYVLPNNVLVREVKERHPSVQLMERKSAYHCERFERDCETTAKRCGKMCKGCPYQQAKRTAKSTPIVVQNTFVYWSHENFTQNVIFDEAHLLLDTLDGLGGVKLWKKDYPFPANLVTLSDVIHWIQERLKAESDVRLKRALASLIRIKGGSEVRYDWDTLRGKSELVLNVIPESIRAIPNYLWPAKVRKLVLMSATIGPQDIYDLGLDLKRVSYITGSSPIPVPQRPAYFWPRVNMRYNLLDIAVPVLAKTVVEILDKYPHDKGIVHVPYSIAQRLKEHLRHERIIFHDKETKAAALTLFKESSPESGKVLIASGLYEGISLDENLSRFQIIAKVPYLSLGDPKIKSRAEREPEWYAWAAIKRLAQAYGRVCRGPADRGDTWILDSNFERLWNEDQRREPHARLFPEYFQQAYKKVPVK